MGLDDLRRDLEAESSLTGVDALRADLLAPAARDEAMSIPTLGEAYSSIAEPVTNAVSWAARRTPMATLAQYLTGTPDETMERGARGAGELIVPQTPTAAGALLGTAALGPLGVTGRILGAAGGAGAGSALSGNPIDQVARDTGLAGLGGAVGEGVGRLGSWLARSTGGAKTRIAHDDAAAHLEEVRRQAGGLARAEVTGDTPSEQLRSLATGAGRRGVGAEKEAVTQAVEEAIGGQEINVPLLARNKGVVIEAEQASPMWNATGPAMPTTISLRAANEELTAIGDGLRHMDIADRSLRERMIQQDYKALAQQIRAGLDEITPGAGEVWNLGQQDAKAGYALIKNLRDRNAWRAGNDGLEQNTSRFQGKLIDPKFEETMRWRLKEGDFDSLVDTLTRGAGIGRVDINAAGRGGAGQSLGEFARRPSAGSASSILTPLRAILPNAGARLVGAPGRVPYDLDPGLQALMNALGIQSADQWRQVQQGQPLKIGPLPGPRPVHE